MICQICTKKISKKDDYVRVTDYKAGKLDLESYYHNKCFRDRVSGKDNPDRVLARGMMIRAMKLLRKAEGVAA